MTLEVALADFLLHLGLEKNASPQTVKAYREDLTQALGFVREQTKQSSTSPADWNLRTLRLLLSWLHGQGYAKRTVARRLAAVRTFGRFLCREGVLAANPADALRGPRLDKTLPHFLTLDDVQKLLAAPGSCATCDRRDGGLAMRDRAWLETLYSGGLRVSELVGLNLADVDLAEGFALVRGKGRKERLALLGDPARLALQDWFVERSALLRQLNRVSDAVFLNYQATRLTTRSVGRLLAKYLQVAGLDPRTTPHTIRHCFATHMLDAGADIRGVQELLGHKSLSTTQIYTHVTTQRLQQSYLKAHPRA
jgi:integrase/recombinase XerC